jgi:hypothetical protein
MRGLNGHAVHLAKRLAAHGDQARFGAQPLAVAGRAWLLAHEAGVIMLGAVGAGLAKEAVDVGHMQNGFSV